jgi:hypothetical protein
MRDHLAHRYFDTSHSILQAATVDHDLPDLELAVSNLIRRLTAGSRTLRQMASPDGRPGVSSSAGSREGVWTWVTASGGDSEAGQEVWPSHGVLRGLLRR